MNERLKWGPFVSERSWGTIREDMDDQDDPWNHLSFEKAQYTAYRFGEDGIAGICDRYQLCAVSPLFWNRKDPIIKERLFGLNSHEGNHGEDVKEIYFHKEAAPDHSYLHYMYRYSQNQFPYDALKEHTRSPLEGEFELVDTGVFDGGAFFDIDIEYGIVNEDIAIMITAYNHGKKPAPLDVLLQVVLRNRELDFSGDDPIIKKEGESVLEITDDHIGPLKGILTNYLLGTYYLYGPPTAGRLFCDNKTRPETSNDGYKDSFHKCLIENSPLAYQKTQGTKAAFLCRSDAIEGQSKVVWHFLLSRKKQAYSESKIEHLVEKSRKNCLNFYNSLCKKTKNSWEKETQMMALSGLIWSQSIYLFDVDYWLKKRALLSNKPLKNLHWQHLNSKRIMIMPDKWEYPWFASWDMAFHAIAISKLDVKIAQEQLGLLLHDQFQHPNGQIPAYEWEYSDINPPVQAYALWQIYEKSGDRAFLEKSFHKLLINFAWWVNKVDSDGKNIFEGGFLGLDNIALWDRSEAVLHDAILKQPDSTGWMALFCLNMMRIALELAVDNKVYAGLAVKFFEHYVYIAHGLNENHSPLWDKEDGFFYDRLDSQDGSLHLKIRSIVGVIPFFAIEWLSHDLISSVEDFKKDFFWFLENRKELTESIIHKQKDGFLLTALSNTQMNSILKYMADPGEFLAPFGIRSVSYYHKDHPYSYLGRSLKYEPQESCEKIKGGNSNWRGPVWLPMNYLVIKALDKLSYEDVPRKIVLHDKAYAAQDLALEICRRCVRLFEPVGNTPIFWGEDFRYRGQKEWTDHLLFYEYFDPDTGKGLGASHQTGWTALISELIDYKNSF